MGLLDLPAPAFAWLDALLAVVLAPLARLAVWAFIAAVVSMLLYRLVSPQRGIAAAASAAAEARRSLNRHDGDFDALLRQVRVFLAASTRHIGLTLPAAVVASLPLVLLLAWLSTGYDRQLPEPGASVAIWLRPSDEPVTWRPPDAATGGAPWRVRWPLPGGEVAVVDRDGLVIPLLPPPAPVAALHKRKWWNVLLGNPAGYLPEVSRLEEIVLDLPRQHVLDLGPPWARTWELPFLTLLALFSLAIKLVFRIR